jgi:inosose dehydratase
MGISVASAPVSWGIMESIPFPPEYPYTRVLDEIAEAGYAGTELGPYGFMPTDPAALQRELEPRHLVLCSAFVAFPLAQAAALEAGLAHVERSARLIGALGAQWLILSDEIAPERAAVAGRRSEANRLSWSDAEWRRAEEAIHQVVTRVAPYGLKVAFHHHAATHIETPEEVANLLDRFAPRDLALCLDTGHYAYGGGDPVALLRRHGSRVRWVHLKDVDPVRLEEVRRRGLDFFTAVRQGVFARLGEGSVDFPGVLALLRELQYDGWVVAEQDVLAGGAGASSPLANARAAREFLHNLGL